MSKKRKRTKSTDVEPLPSTTPTTASNPKDERVRFEIELEYVQCLANPDYIQHLAQIGTLDDLKFIQYLQYLQETWTQPEYSRYLTFPHCLTYLRLLQESSFRQLAKEPRFMADVKYQRDLHFFHHKTAEIVEPNPLGT